MNDEALMRQALAQAELAAQLGEVPVGAVLQLADGRHIAAHNAPISTSDGCGHAEIRVIRAACQASNNYRLPKATLAVTLEPCLMCCGAIIHARIERVIYGASDPKAGAVQSLYQTLSDARLNHQPQLTGGVLAEPCSQLLRHFFQQRRQRPRGDATSSNLSNGAPTRP
ncbi:MAG: tRNA adenosine(34) deaminase TadA [Mariprofundales bacterium]|nr:tRNA adenosine(34) deaminase TadA [Mariprofundales bacterium]